MMKTEIVEVSATQRELKIEIGADAVREVYQKVCQTYARGAQIPGFRKGFAPVDVVKLRFTNEIRNQVLQELLQKNVPQAIQENALQPISDPQIHLEDDEKIKLNGSQNFMLTVIFDVMPEIPTPEYKGLEATRRVRPITEEEVSEIIEERRKNYATLIPIEDRASENGDTLIVDLEGIFADSPETDPIKADDLELTLGDENMETSFTDNLVGVREDEEKEFTVTYSEDFTSQFLAGKTVNYKAKIKSVGRKELPELDDEWAESLDEGYESFKDLREKLTADLKKMAKSDGDARVSNDLLAKLIENHPFEVPNVLIEKQARNLLNNFAIDMKNRGVDLDKIENEFVQAAYNQMREQAERDVRGAMLLEKIAELEKIEISSEEIAQEIEYMSIYYGVSPEDIRKTLEKQGGEANIALNLRTRKAIDAIVANANITDAEWDGEIQKPAEATEKTKEGAKKQKKKAAKKSD